MKTENKTVLKTVLKTQGVIWVKIMYSLFKRMSFIKVKDPRKREELIRDFIETRKRIKDNFISRKVGESEYQTGLTKLFKPVTETQKATAKEITEAQKTATKGITEAQKETTKELIKRLRPIEDAPPPYEFPFAGEYEVPGEYKDPGKEITEKTEKGYKLGRVFIDLDKENKNVLDTDGEIYTDSNKIYDILTNKNTNVIWDDLNEEKLRLGVLIINSGAIQKDQNNRPNKLGGNTKWNNIYSHIWFNRPYYYTSDDILNDDELKRDAFNLYKKPNKKTSETKERIKEVLNIEDVKFDKRRYKTPKERPTEKTGTGLKILPSDTNALIDRFDLLFSSKKAGHTGVRNEIVSILDELKRQGVLKTNEYKKLNSLIKK